MSGRYMYTYNRPVQVEFESITAPTRHETECGETEETKERKKEDETRRENKSLIPRCFFYFHFHLCRCCAVSLLSSGSRLQM